MAALKEIHICVFKPLRCDVVSAEGRLSARLETEDVNALRGRDDGVSFNSLILTAWALLLKYYLATDLISFASSGTEYVTPITPDGSETCTTSPKKCGLADLIHSLEVADQDTIYDVVQRIQEPAAQRPFDSALLPCLNTLLIYRQMTSAITQGETNGLDDVAPAIASQLDICLTVTDNEDVLSLDIELCATKFSQPLAHRLLRTYHNILRLVSSGSPSQTVTSLDPLTEDDLKQICEWNEYVPRRLQTCVHTTFEEHAKRRPQAPAVCSWDGELTYAELNALSTKLAHHLSRLGVGPEILVPYGFEKSLYAVVATVAVLKAGGAFVPLDASHPKDRLKSIIGRVEAKLILASAKTAPTFEALLPNVLIVDRAFLDTLPEEEHNPNSGVGPENSAFVLFTSGSTGEPKGLVQEHGSVCTVNEAYRQALFIDENSRVLNFAAHTFDVSTVDVFTTLSQGGCICIPSEEDRLNDIVRVINDFRVSWVDLTPSFAMASFPRPSDIPTLKTLILAGEEVKQEHVTHFVGRIERVINCYGPAEAGGVLANVYESPISQPHTIGLALSNASCWIVDLKNPGRLAPIGAIGELVVEGSTLARGYLKDPAKTKAAFFSHPGYRSSEANMPPQLLYRTGDLVQYRPDGLMNFLGRQDTQVKIRGQRIEMREIEQHLSQDVAIERCLVEFPQSGVYAKRLVAVIEPRIPQDHDPLDATSSLKLLPAEALLRSGFSLENSTKMLENKVPAYMRPTVWLVVTGLPLSDSKKVDRRKARDWLANLSLSDNPVASSDASRIPLIPTSNELALDVSRKASTIIANGNSQVFASLNGRSFDLVAAGIDSIQVMTLSRWIQDEYGLKLSVDKLARRGLNIDELARVIAAFQGGQEPEKPQSQGLDIRGEVNALSKNFNVPRLDPLHRSVEDQPVSTVLLTGATGFLGIEILHQLLCNPDIRKVFVHMRASGEQQGRERIVTAAKKADWWSASFSDRLEIWPGDLDGVKLGLTGEQWDRLTGNALEEASIDAVIHNGAAVRWNLGYESLRAANTLSTAQLLEAMAERQSSGRFVYVSGGQVLTTGDDDEDLMAEQGAHLNGYGQSKVVSELLVKRFAESERGKGHVVRVVKPSYIIGDAKRGVANQSDYLWRLTKSAIELGTYSSDGRKGWLFVSDVVTVADAVCQICKAQGSAPTVVKILDGLVMQDFWNVLTKAFKYKLKSVEGGKWWSSLRSHVEQTGSHHCLWALQDILEAKRGEIASIETVPTAEMTTKSPAIRLAIRSNVQYLRDDTQFFPPGYSRCSIL